MKLIFENWRKYLKEAAPAPVDPAAPTVKLPAADEIMTMGDLRAAIKGVRRAKLTKKGLNVAYELMGLIPAIGTAKTVFDILRTAYASIDDDKTGTAIDKLNVDDQITAIIDDKIENGFMKFVGTRLGKLGDDVPIPDINKALIAYLKKNFENRSVTLPGEEQ